MNRRNVLPFGVPETEYEILASLASACVFAAIVSALLMCILFWIEP